MSRDDTAAEQVHVAPRAHRDHEHEGRGEDGETPAPLDSTIPEDGELAARQRHVPRLTGVVQLALAFTFTEVDEITDE